MRIAVIGAGAIGCLVAAYLHKAGKDVLLIGRPDQVKAVGQNGIHVKGVRGDERINVRADVALRQEYDLVIFATKTQDIDDAFAANNQFLESGLVLTTQNGVQADNILSCHFDKSRQLTSIVMFGSTYTKPGEIIHNFEGDWILGRPFSPLDPVVHKIGEELATAFKVSCVPDIMGQKYLKLFVNFNNCIPALTGKSMQETFTDIKLCALSIRLLKEGLEILKHANIELASMATFPKEKILGLAAMPEAKAAAIVSQSLTNLSKEPLYGSILQSILRGRVSEIEFINGEVVHLASHIKMQAPLNTRVVQMVHEVERTGKFYTNEQIIKAFELA